MLSGSSWGISELMGTSRIVNTAMASSALIWCSQEKNIKGLQSLEMVGNVSTEPWVPGMDVTIYLIA